MLLHEDEISVAPGGHQAEQWKPRVPLWRVLAEPGGIDVPLKVVDPQEGKIPREGEGLSGIHTHQQRARKSGAAGHGYTLQLIQVQASLLQGLMNNWSDGKEVLPGGHFGHNASIASMLLYLRGDDVGKQSPSILDNRRRRFITRGFDSQNEHSREKSLSWANWPEDDESWHTPRARGTF